MVATGGHHTTHVSQWLEEFPLGDENVGVHDVAATTVGRGRIHKMGDRHAFWLQQHRTTTSELESYGTGTVESQIRLDEFGKRLAECRLWL